MTEISRPDAVETEHDLGEGTVAVWLRKGGGGEVIGLIERHDCIGDSERPSGGAVMFVAGYGPTQLWTVEAGSAGTWDGLTLSPSILCRACGHHGFIRDGRWVPA